MFISNILYACFVFWLYFPWLRSLTQNIILLYLLSGTVLIYLPLNFLLFYGLRQKYQIDFNVFGWNPHQIKIAAVLFFIFGGIIEIFMLVLAFVSKSDAIFNPNLSNPLYFVFGFWILIGEIIGNSLFEEMLYRGLGYEVFQEYQEKSNSPTTKRAPILFLGLQAIFFSLMHIPNRIYNKFPLDLMAISLLLVFGIGFWLGFCYYKTKSIPFVIILHTLNNIGVFFTNQYFLSLFALVPLSFFGIYVINRIQSKNIE